MSAAAQSIAVTEDAVPVAGAVLRYRLAGDDVSAPVIVFENGWSGSFPYADWLQSALAPDARVLCYDRAGIGSSESRAPLSCAGITAHLVELLDALKITTPVVVAGHSYGGLIGALHAVQAPQRVQAVVQIDPTSELDDPVIDGPLRTVPILARLLQLRALLGGPGLLDKQAAADLSPDAMRRLRYPRRAQLRSLHWAIREIRLLAEIRRTIAAGDHAAKHRRLVISANADLRPKTGIARHLVSDARAARHQQAFQALHQRQAGYNAGSRWLHLPYDHLGLITRRKAAETIAGQIRGFLEA